MENYPHNLLDLEQMFSTEEDCLNYLRDIRWSKGFICPRCKGNQAWRVAGELQECSTCGRQTSVIAGTIFQDTKKPLVLWFRAIWLITSQKYGTNALGLQRVLGLGSYRTAWTWLQKLRKAMVRPGRDRLSGQVEVDETVIGSTKTGKRGRGALGKTLVLIAAQKDERRIGRIRLQCIPDASGSSIETSIESIIVPGTIICTDGWQGYNGLAEKGYTHEIIRKGACVGDDLLPRCHRIAGLLKRWLEGTLHGSVRPRYLDYYLDEFTFRFNRRKSTYRGKLFYRLIEQAVSIDPVPLDKIVVEARNNPYI
jgi:transposase-like protein